MSGESLGYVLKKNIRSYLRVDPWDLYHRYSRSVGSPSEAIGFVERQISSNIRVYEMSF